MMLKQFSLLFIFLVYSCQYWSWPYDFEMAQVTFYNLEIIIPTVSREQAGFEQDRCYLLLECTDDERYTGCLSSRIRNYFRISVVGYFRERMLWE